MDVNKPLLLIITGGVIVLLGIVQSPGDQAARPGTRILASIFGNAGLRIIAISIGAGSIIVGILMTFLEG